MPNSMLALLLLDAVLNWHLRNIAWLGEMHWSQLSLILNTHQMEHHSRATEQGAVIIGAAALESVIQANACPGFAARLLHALDE